MTEIPEDRQTPRAVLRLGPDGSLIESHLPDELEFLAPVRDQLARPAPTPIVERIRHEVREAMASARSTRFRMTLPPRSGDRGVVVLVLPAGPWCLVLIAEPPEGPAADDDLARAVNGERIRLGQELHDELCQQLTGLSFLARNLEWTLRERSMPEADEAARLANLARASVAEVRRICRGLCPVDLGRVALEAALRELVGSIDSSGTIELRFDLDGPQPELDPEVRMHVYRIAQESLTNAIRHADPTRVVLRLGSSSDAVTLEVEDDGIGFDPSLPTRGMGLEILRARARRAGATLDISSAPGQGTRIVCRLARP